jgi:hypothetical protein
MQWDILFKAHFNLYSKAVNNQEQVIIAVKMLEMRLEATIPVSIQVMCK